MKQLREYVPSTAAVISSVLLLWLLHNYGLRWGTTERKEKNQESVRDDGNGYESFVTGSFAVDSRGLIVSATTCRWTAVTATIFTTWRRTVVLALWRRRVLIVG